MNKVRPCRAKGDRSLARAVHRNSVQYAWLMSASHVVPASVPRLYGRSDRESGFAMQFIGGERVYLSKAALLASAPDRNEAALVGAVLKQIHAASAKPEGRRRRKSERQGSAKWCHVGFDMSAAKRSASILKTAFFI